VKELERIQLEMQGDITYLYDQLKRILDRLKQRASRAARDSDDRPDDVPDHRRPGDVSHFSSPALVEQDPSSSSLAPSDHDPSQPLLSKEQVRELYRSRSAGRA
jgi:hypothetical protein